MGTEGKNASSTAVQAKCKVPVDRVKNMRANSHCQRELSMLCCTGDLALPLEVSPPQHQTEGNTSYSQWTDLLQLPPPDLNQWCKNIHASQSNPWRSTFTQLERTPTTATWAGPKTQLGVKLALQITRFTLLAKLRGDESETAVMSKSEAAGLQATGCACSEGWRGR